MRNLILLCLVCSGFLVCNNRAITNLSSQNRSEGKHGDDDDGKGGSHGPGGGTGLPGPPKTFIVLGNITANTAIWDSTAATVTAGPALTGNVDDGASAFTIPSGPYTNQVLVIHSNGLNSTRYNPVTNSTYAGPLASCAISAGSSNFRITSGPQNGKQLVVCGGNTTSTTIYDPATHTFSVGPVLTATVGTGGNSFAVTSGVLAGRHLVMLGNSTPNTSVFDPGTVTFAAGPTTTGNVTTGSLNFVIEGGAQAGQTFLFLGGFAASRYNPTTNSFSVAFFSNGTGVGAHAVKVPYQQATMVIYGGDTSHTGWYDHSTNSVGIGYPISLCGIGSLGIAIGHGPYDGFVLQAVGAGSTFSWYYNAQALPVPTYTPGPTMPGPVGVGAFAITLP